MFDIYKNIKKNQICNLRITFLTFVSITALLKAHVKLADIMNTPSLKTNYCEAFKILLENNLYIYMNHIGMHLGVLHVPTARITHLTNDALKKFIFLFKSFLSEL